MKAVMYHYVRKSSQEYPFFKSLDLKDFRKQLDYFQTAFGFVPKNDFLNSFRTGEVPSGVVLTFDDGLKDHFQFVLPELQKRGLWGIFYIPTMVYHKKECLDVHKIHLLLGRFESRFVYSKLVELINDKMLGHGSVRGFRESTYPEQVNDDYTSIVKRTLNFFIGYEYRKKVLTLLMDYFLPAADELFDSFYLSLAEIKNMQAAGMMIGSHTVSHPVMSKLSRKEQQLEICESFDFLEKATGGLDVKTFCYPYGGYHSFTDETEDLLQKHSCAFSFNVEFRDINTNDLLYRPQALPRYDCNCFPFGACGPVTKSESSAEIL